MHSDSGDENDIQDGGTDKTEDDGDGLRHVRTDLRWARENSRDKVYGKVSDGCAADHFASGTGAVV